MLPDRPENDPKMPDCGHFFPCFPSVYLPAVKTENPPSSLVTKYRPSSLDQLVLPTAHNVEPALQFVRAPYPSAWLVYGKPGLGKTSMASIMAAAAAQNPYSLRTYMGPDLDSSAVRELALTVAQPPLFGHYYGIVVNESDSIPRGGQIRLLGLLDDLRHAAIIFTDRKSVV